MNIFNKGSVTKKRLMVKHLHISILLVIALFATTTYGQNAVNATMRVSVNIVTASSVNVEKPELVLLTQNKKSDLGTVNFKCTDEEAVFVKNADKILLTDEGGNQVTMSINTHKKEDKGTNSIRFQGTSEGQFLSNMYQGELTTSIVYL